MTASRIQDAALKRFAEQGYEATTLAEIAGDVGIKKPSIYAHFQSKEALFQSLIELSAKRELDFARMCIRRRTPVAEALFAYLKDTAERYESTPHLRFWLRLAYLTPLPVVPRVMNQMTVYAASLKTIVREALEDETFGLVNPALPLDILTMAYIGILRSVHAELMHCSPGDHDKLIAALWSVFERSLGPNM